MKTIGPKSFLTALVAAAFLTGCGSTGIGDILGGGNTGGNPDGTGNPNDPYDQRFGDVQGTVESVNTRDRSIVVDSEGVSPRYNLRNGNGGDEIVLYYDDSTRVEYQGQTFHPQDLERGDRILVNVDQSSGRLIAQDIEVLHDATSGGIGSADDDLRTGEVRGTVRSVDTRGRTLEVVGSTYGSSFSTGPTGRSTGRSDVVLVHYDADTIVEFEGRRYAPENLERGDVVEIEIQDLGGRLLAQEILVVGEGGAAGR